MADLKSGVASAAPKLLSLLRIVVGFTFATHGAQKLFGFPTPMPVPVNAFLTFAGTLEIVGGLLIFVGFVTRPVAFILSGMMAVAYWTVHAKTSFWPLVNGGELAVVYCFVFLYLAAAGAGPWSLDAATRRAA
jgi:putative oxidoreductase